MEICLRTGQSPGSLELEMSNGIKCTQERKGHTWSIVFWLERNSTKRGTTPQSMTRSMGGFFSLERSLE